MNDPHQRNRDTDEKSLARWANRRQLYWPIDFDKYNRVKKDEI